MSNLPSEQMSAVESALVRNDISKLTSHEKMAYVDALCASVGLNKLTKPFAFLSLQGREVVYATKDCTEQLRKIHGVSTQIVSQSTVGDSFEVHIRAQDRTGRTDEDFASIPLGNIKGEALSNLKMKCITKAKRRVTLSICGLGILDVSELDTIATEMKVAVSNPQIVNPLKVVPEPVAEIPEVFQDEDLGEYVCQIGRKYKGIKLKDIGEHELNGYLEWLLKQAAETGRGLGQAQEFADKAEAYLKSREFEMETRT